MKSFPKCSHVVSATWLLLLFIINSTCHASLIPKLHHAKIPSWSDATDNHGVLDVAGPRGGAAAASASTTTTLTTTLSSLPTWSHKLLAGGTSRALAQALLYPIDALRTLAQTRDGRTLADVGAKSLIRGCAQTSSFALFTGALQFGIFGFCKEKFHCGPLLASAAGAAGSCLISVPQEVMKQRLVTGVYGSFREALTRIWKVEGMLGFYSGWKPTVSRNVPFVVVTFCSRDLVRDKILEYKRKKMEESGGDICSRDLVRDKILEYKRKKMEESGGDIQKVQFTTMENLAIGITSALVAGVVTQPIDTVKTRLMTQAASNAVPYKNAMDCAVTMLRTEGWKKFYSGFAQRSIYMCGLWGITFSMEPLLSRYLEKNGE